MTGMKVVPFFLLISLMISSTQALDAFLTDGIGRFSYQTVIHTRSETIGRKTVKHYVGRDKKDTFDAQSNTKLVIVYIKGAELMGRTQLGVTRLEQRRDLAGTLRTMNCELLYLAIGSFQTKTERGVVGDFLRSVIIANPNVGEDFQIVTIGVNNFTNVIYGRPSNELKKYNPGEHLVGYDLLKELTFMDRKI